MFVLYTCILHYSVLRYNIGHMTLYTLHLLQSRLAYAWSLQDSPKMVSVNTLSRIRRRFSSLVLLTALVSPNSSSYTERCPVSERRSHWWNISKIWPWILLCSLSLISSMSDCENPSSRARSGHWEPISSLTVLFAVSMQPEGQVFRVKKLVCLLPQLELLAVFIRKSGHSNMSKQCNHIQKVQAHIVSLRHEWAHRHR